MRLSVPILVAIVCSIGHAVPSTKRATGLRFVGVNEAGAEFGSAHLPGIYNTDYTFPDPDSISTFIDKGFNIFRVPIAMERLTPTGLTGALDSAYLGHLKDTINLITGAGAYAVIDPHNFGRFNGAIITSTTDFQSWWAKVAAQFKGNSKVIFDTNNEYVRAAVSIYTVLSRSRNTGTTANLANLSQISTKLPSTASVQLEPLLSTSLSKATHGVELGTVVCIRLNDTANSVIGPGRLFPAQMARPMRRRWVTSLILPI